MAGEAPKRIGGRERFQLLAIEPSAPGEVVDVGERCRDLGLDEPLGGDPREALDHAEPEAHGDLPVSGWLQRSCQPRERRQLVHCRYDEAGEATVQRLVHRHDR